MLAIPRPILEALLEHARREDPLECCGVLAGRNGRVLRHFPTANADRSPITYRIDSRDLFRIHKAVGEAGMEILGIYHSHTASQAYPSATDVERAFWEGTDTETYPGCVHLIISLAEGNEPVVRGFRIPTRARIEEVPIEIVEEADS